MDSAARYKSQGRHEQLQSETIASEIELMKQRLEQAISRHHETIRFPGGRRSLLRPAQIKAWFGALPSVMQGIGDQSERLPKRRSRTLWTSLPSEPQEKEAGN